MTVLNFGQISVISRKRYKIETYFQWKTNRKSYVAYRMTLVLVTLNDLEGHSPVAGLFKCNPSNICAVFYQISTDSALARSLSDSWASCILKLFFEYNDTDRGSMAVPGPQIVDKSSKIVLRSKTIKISLNSRQWLKCMKHKWTEAYRNCLRRRVAVRNEFD